MSNEMNQEIREAIIAGENALQSLREAQQYLNSAGNWGLIDIFGGGLFSTLMKHSKIDDARQCMEVAQENLMIFQEELEDIAEFLPGIEIGEFLTFADFFFDGFLADVFVQSKIGDAKQQISEAIDRVQSILGELKQEL